MRKRHTKRDHDRFCIDRCVYIACLDYCYVCRSVDTLRATVVCVVRKGANVKRNRLIEPIIDRDNVMLIGSMLLLCSVW